MKNVSSQSETVAQKSVKNTSNKESFWHNAQQLLIIFVAALATAASLEIFLLPSNVVIGGALGISSILDILVSANKWYFSAGVWLVAINIPIFVYCLTRFSRRFAVKTLLYVLLLAVLLIVLRLLNVSKIFKEFMYGESENDKVLYVILGGALHGISLPMMLSVNASTGGSDIVALIMQKHNKKSSNTAMRLILAANVFVVLVSSVVLYIVHNSIKDAINMFIYSVAALFICEIVQEWIFSGFSAAIELEITTDKPDEMVSALQSGLKHGTTTIKVQGGYSHQEKRMILCVINKQQLTLARRIINQVDVNAFAYVENVKEVLGKGFANKEIGLDEE